MVRNCGNGKMVNNIVLRGDTKIGNVGAETDDEFLFKCFIDHPALSEIKDLNNSKMFFLGSTGIGKTAILRMIKHQAKDSIDLELTEMSLRSISNSSAISFLLQLDIDISLFLQALWKRVILVEYAKVFFKMNKTESKQNLFQRFTSNWRNVKTEQILKEFLETNEDSFWETTDKTVIDVTQKLETDLSAEFGAEVAKAQGKLSYARSLGEERKTQYQERAKKYVNSDLLTQLARVTSALAEESRDSRQSFFILIDKIDEPWVDEKLKNILVHSLFEACKSLRKIRNMKVVVALRNDVYEKMNADFPASAFQMEKNEDFIARIKWTKDELYSLVDKRINHLFRYKYTATDVHFGDVFKDNYDNKSKTFSYMLERTLNRPRDLIKFVNFCFEVSEGKSEISKNNFSTAEGLYSIDRRDALVHEWHHFSRPSSVY